MRPLRSRRLRIAFVVLIFVMAAAVAWWWNFGPRRATQFIHGGEQNVLLITIDTLRADALGSYGGRAATPHLDRLAAEGLRFTFAHAHAVVTLPSHASIMTGRYPFDHGVRDNYGYRLADDADTLAEVAKRSGFATGAFVGAFPLDRQFGLAQGFDVYDDVGGREVVQGDFKFTERRAGAVVDATRRWIGAQPGKWFAWVHVFDPHSSYAPPPPFDRQYGDDPYAGEVAYVDQALAPLIEMVRGAPRPTTVVVTSDHGEGLGEHGELTHGVFAYEATLRVPLFLSQVGAGVIPEPGQVSDLPAAHVDIYPTIARLLNVDTSAELPGRPLLEARDADRTTYFEAMTPMLSRGWAPLVGVLAGRHKYIELPEDELYDLAADAKESRNLVGREPDRTRTLVAELRRFAAPLPGDPRAESAEVRQRLQALGYVSGSVARKTAYTAADDPKNLIDVDRLMMEGIDFNRRRRHGDAIAAYRRVVERRPDMPLAYLRLAFVQWDAGSPAEAIATLREGLQRVGPNVDLEVRLGTYLAETGRAVDAIPLLERTITAAPNNSEAQNALGIAQARAGQPARALRSFERALTANPRDVYAYENVGTVYLQQGDMARARAAFERALANDPRSSRAEAGLGVVARQQGRTADAIAHWRKAVAIDPTNFDALFNIANELAAAGRMEEARPYLSQFVATAPAAFYARDIERFRQLLGR